MTEKTLRANGLDLVVEEFGQPEAPAILLIMGLGTQMVAWPDEFCQGLADGGYRVIRFDNRDIGLSQKFHQSPVPNIIATSILGRINFPFKVAYTLADMADDALGILDALGIHQAHVAGVSMGGMIGQHVAAKAPDRILSLTSIMSSSGRRRVPAASKEIIAAMFKPASASEETAVAQRIKIIDLIGSVGSLKSSPEETRAKVLKSYRRSVHPNGLLRQMAAIVRDGSRKAILESITVPTLVIHGKADRLVPIQGGIDTARLIRGSKLELIDEMGHDLPSKLIPQMSDLILQHARQHD